VKVVRIEATDTIQIRQMILYPNGSIDECHYKGDDDENTFHLGAFVDSKLVSVASFFYQKHPDLPGENHYRLRGMATLPEFQKQGFSSALLKTAFPIIKQNFCNYLWCHARLSAAGYYEKVGFKRMSESFEVPTTGTHILMSKEV
jgi:GNAT superfamily N-acetyltransferase